MPKKQVIRKNALVPTVLISGGAGFIGSHLAEFLLENKARVIVVDNFKTGKDIHVKHLIKNKNFALYDADINKGIPDEIESVDYIFHLAGLEEYLFSKDYVSLDSLLTNSLGTKSLLDLAKHSEAKFLLASTIDVYQGRLSQLYLERYFGRSKTEENKFSLIEAKRFAEAMVWEYYKSNNVDARIVRLPEVYGPRMSLDSSGSLGGFLKSLLDSKPLIINGEGTEKEFYLYISDVVSGLVKALFNKDTSGNIYSLVPDDSMTTLEIAYYVKGLADGELGIEFKEVSDGVVSLRTPDTFNLKGLYWKPKVDFKQGIIDTLKYFGYTANTHAFKPEKLLEQKKLREDENLRGDRLSSLQEVKGQEDNFTDKKVSKRKKVKMQWSQQELDRNTELKKTKMPLRFTKKENKIGSRLRSYYFGLKVDVGYSLSILAIVLAALLVFVGIPSLSFYFGAKRGVGYLLSAESSVETFDLESIEDQTEKAYGSLLKSRQSLHKIKWGFKLFGKQEQFRSYDKLLSSLTNFSKSTNTVSKAVSPVMPIWEILRPDTELTLSWEDISNSELLISSAKSSLSLSEADISAVEIESLPEKVRPEVYRYKDYLYKFEDTLDTVSVVFSDLPNILGFGSERKYILWFQNSNEIRPTGGFIGSYGVLTIGDGKIKNLQIDDIYNPDGQIDIRDIEVIPPEPISEFLSEDRLYLRNSNWDPDFSRSVYAFDDLYFKVTGDVIDGYIAVDLKFVEDLLEATGPIFLAAYNEEITSDNLDERAQFYSSFDYQEGSNDKRSFLTILGGKLLERLFSLDQENLGPVIGQVNKSLSERHLMLLFTNSPVNSILKENKWDGSLVSTSGDYLYVVNANLGGTKANYHVKNKMTYEVSSLTRDGLLRADLYLDYTHTAEESAWPSGPYTDYIRVLTQSGSKLTGARIIYGDGSEEDIFEDVLVSRVGSYNSFETSFKVDPAENIRLAFSYDLPQELSLTKGKKQYELYWQKQPGTNDDEYFFSFLAPFGTEAESLSTGLESVASSQEGNKVYSSSGFLNEDNTFFLLLR